MTLHDRRDVLRYLVAAAALEVLDARASTAEPGQVGRTQAGPGRFEAPDNAVRIPFTHFGRRGIVAVTYGAS